MRVKSKQSKLHPTQKYLTELKAYLGLLTYYGKFLPNLGNVLAPLYQLLRKDVKWNWGEQEQISFYKSKEMLTSIALLVHYDPTKLSVLSCDASWYGVKAVLSQVGSKEEKLVAYASRTLTKAERNYNQLEKEGLALLFGVKKFHVYLFGRNFTLCTDHKPLQSLLSESKLITCMVSACIQRLVLTLASYEYMIKYKSDPANSNADT